MKRALLTFDTDRIHSNYLEVQANFADINSRLNCRRDEFSDEVMANLLQAYRYINQRLTEKPKMHKIEYSDMLELNTIVLTGVNPMRRVEYQSAIDEAKNKSARYIGDLMKWYARHEHHKDDPYDIAAGLYVRILARPQLFVEGNHRTGSLVANYHLLMSGCQPFILTSANAVEFFNLASDVKFQDTSIKSKFKRVTGWGDEKARMKAFLASNGGAFTKEGESAVLVMPPLHQKGHKKTAARQYGE